MRLTPFRSLVAAAAFLACAPYARATIITETTDLSNVLSAPTTLATFTIGANTVSGSVDASTGDTHDIFHIVLPAGASLSSVTVTISNFGGSTPNPTFGVFATPGPSPAGLDGLNSSGNFTLQFSNFKPVVLGYTNFAMGAGSVNIDGSLYLSQTASHYSYTATFLVVPTPGAATILALPGLRLAFRRPRRTRGPLSLLSHAAALR